MNGARTRGTPPGRRASLCLALYVAVVLASTPFTARVVARLETSCLGWSVLVGAPLVGAGALAAVAARGLSRAALRATVPAWGIIAGSYLALWRYLCQRPVEGVHLAQYALMSGLAFRALRGALPRRLAYAAAGALSVTVSCASELFQSVLPDRIYDLRDVALDGIGCLFGLALVWQSERSALLGAR